MIWFNLKELENKISNDELSDRDGFNYLLAFFILSTIGYSLGSGNSSGWVKFIGLIISILINIWGLKTIYAANKEVDGKDFFKRFFAFYWVIGFRLFVIILPIAMIIGVLIGIFSVKSAPDFSGNNPIIDLIILIFVSMFSVICYLLMINSVQKIKLKTMSPS
jgi:hypothetical protein